MGSLPAGTGYLLGGLVLLVIFSTGCTIFSPPVDQQKTLQVSSEAQDSINLPFSEAIEQLHMVSSSGSLDPSYKIHSIRGNQVDINSDARSWVFGVTSGAENKLIVFARGSSPDVQIWTGTLPDSEISLDSIVLPKDLFTRRAALIKGFLPEQSSGETTLELAGRVYSLTTSSKGGASTYQFDAKSGELIHSP
jgi:hypothetical protein